MSTRLWRPVYGEGDRAPSDREERDRQQRGDLDAHHRAGRAPALHAGHEQRPQRQRDVEGGLDGQRPRRADAAQRRGQPRVLQEPVVDPPVAGEDAAQPDGRGQHGEREPVGGHDAQHAPARVVADARRRAAREARGQERAVEQEARDHEEEGHAHVQPRRVGPERVEQVEARDRRHVGDEDRAGRDRAHAVERAGSAGCRGAARRRRERRGCSRCGQLTLDADVGLRAWRPQSASADGSRSWRSPRWRSAPRRRSITATTRSSATR